MRRRLVLLSLAGVFLALSLPGGQAPPAPRDCADVNGDHAVNVSDPLFLLAYLFAGGPAPTACAQDSDRVERLEARVEELAATLVTLDEELQSTRQVLSRYQQAVPLHADDPFTGPWCVEAIRECP